MSKHGVSRSNAMTYPAQWIDSLDTATEHGVSGNESGVGIWHSSDPSLWGEGGRQYTREEWLASGPSLSHAPKDACDRIDEVARCYAKKPPKPASSGPITPRASLDVPQPTAEEQRAMRLDQLFGKPGWG